MHDALRSPQPEAEAFVEVHVVACAEERNRIHIRQACNEPLDEGTSDALPLMRGMHDDVVDVRVEVTIGDGTGEADELVTSPCADRESGGQDGGDVVLRPLRPPRDGVVELSDRSRVDRSLGGEQYLGAHAGEQWHTEVRATSCCLNVPLAWPASTELLLETIDFGSGAVRALAR
jgi:hypothetical protein